MTIQRGTLIRSLLILVLGAAVGAAGGALVYKKLHPSTGQDAAASRPDASRSLAPPEEPADANPKPEVPANIVAVAMSPVEEAPQVVIPPDPGLVVPEIPPEAALAKPEEATASESPAGPEFFGVQVGSAGDAPASVPSSGLQRLRLMNGRCVAGFDAKTSVVDFSGWTKNLTGELTYEPGRPVESARGSVTADPTTMDTGDAARDKELREEHLECATFPRMGFEISVVKMTSVGTVDMSGSMEIHGIKKDVTIPCSFKLRSDGFAYVAGEIKVKMTDFGIKPPTKLGIITVEDEIRIWFEIWAEPVKEPSK
ncbi:MAG: YceI family protein [Planctomycetota bacterium]